MPCRPDGQHTTMAVPMTFHSRPRLPSERWTDLAVAGSPLVVFVLADAVSWLIDVRRDHCLRISG
jgi:hypothetical protein